MGRSARLALRAWIPALLARRLLGPAENHRNKATNRRQHSCAAFEDVAHKHLKSPMTPLKILMFSVDYPPDLGGISGHVYRLSRALANQGALVTVVGGHVLTHVMPAPSTDAVQPMLREIRIRRA